MSIDQFSAPNLASKMQLIKRFQIVQSHIQESLADHSYMLSLLIIDYSYKYPLVFKNISIEKILKCAILHDLVEIVTGDIPFSTKVSLENGENLFSEMEKIASTKITETRSTEFLESLHKAINFESESSYEEILFKLLDLFCVTIKCYNEFSLGNKNYIPVLQDNIDRMRIYYKKIFNIEFASLSIDQHNLLRELFINEIYPLIQSSCDIFPKYFEKRFLI